MGGSPGRLCSPAARNLYLGVINVLSAKEAALGLTTHGGTLLLSPKYYYGGLWVRRCPEPSPSLLGHSPDIPLPPPPILGLAQAKQKARGRSSVPVHCCSGAGGRKHRMSPRGSFLPLSSAC